MSHVRLRCKGFWLELLVSFIWFVALGYISSFSTISFLAFLSPAITNTTWLLVKLFIKSCSDPTGRTNPTDLNNPSPQTKLANTLSIPGKWGAVSLGSLIVGDSKLIDYLPHELGHSKQALVLGPLYWVIIGLPSLTHAMVWQTFGRKWNYYSFFTEQWAEHWKEPN